MNTDGLVTELVEIIKSSKDFAIEQAPDVARQMILRQEIVGAIFLVAALFFYLSWFKLYRYLKKEEQDESIWFLYVIFGSVAGLFFFAFGLCVIDETITVIFAPKVYLLEHLSSIIKH